ncbi:uncharacterized protein N0V89_001490 [Didymosphaeria variabile]|uniref:Heterokaryon incompatibility domain-containing protein n=1 Tax=Didymosphaeria variabile TaxID=1932322 RepID=A0A9W9CGW0_9PLEO|nr:uncharacterized protein N0V89_001490 [Didymosphaeria variabile]KAJ4360921.1 hypothetical protein N0V89_001490 [Didymosphaeria variabile]
MDEIYKTAESVIAWLGPASETSSGALDFMNILAESSRSPECDNNVRPHPVILELNTFRMNPDVASEIMATRVETNVDEVLERLWFSRMWVIQEVLLVKDLVLHIGDHTVPWTQFRRAIKMLWAAEQYVPRPFDEDHDGGSIYYPLGLVYARDQLQANDSGTTIFQDYTMQIYVRTKDFKRWGCKDDRDRVFEILGFIPQDLSLRLEQRRSPAVMDIVQSLVMKYAEKVLEHVPDDLFSAPELFSHDLLPSWVPDLRPDLVNPTHRSWRPMNFHAAMNGPPAAILDKQCAHMIAVRGKVFDKITQTIPTPTSSPEKRMTHKETLVHIIRIWYATKAFYAAQGNQYPVLSESTQNHDAIFDNLITASNTNSSLVSLMSSNPPGFVPKILVFLKEVSDRGTTALHEHYASPNPSPTAAETASFVMTVSRLFSADQVIFTETGFVALAPHGAREGSRVAWVNGLQSFLVVREMLGRGGLFEVVGPGFLVGAMEGRSLGRKMNGRDGGVGRR